MFRIIKEESELLVRCKNCTALDSKYFNGKEGETRYLPCAFPKGTSVNIYAKRRNQP